MGGRSSSSSSSSNTTKTEQHDNRVAVEAGGIGVGANANATIEQVDFGVIEGARAVLETGLAGAADAVSQISSTFSNALDKNHEILAEKVEADNKEISRLMIYFMVAAAGVLGILAWAWGKK